MLIEREAGLEFFKLHDKGYEFNAHSLFSYILLKVLSEFSFIVLKPLFIANKTPAIINTNTTIRGI